MSIFTIRLIFLLLSRYIYLLFDTHQSMNLKCSNFHKNQFKRNWWKLTKCHFNFTHIGYTYGPIVFRIFKNVRFGVTFNNMNLILYYIERIKVNIIIWLPKSSIYSKILSFVFNLCSKWQKKILKSLSIFSTNFTTTLFRLQINDARDLKHITYTEHKSSFFPNGARVYKNVLGLCFRRVSATGFIFYFFFLFYDWSKK